MKARVRRGCATVEELKTAVRKEKKHLQGGASSDSTTANYYPRWIRINNICTSLEKQLKSTFSSYRRVDSLALLAQEENKVVYVDAHIPDLVAVPPGIDFSNSTAYKNGEIILQDKASCFPAYLLIGDADDQQPWQGDVIDGCAAPGNKTTHLASLLHKQQSNSRSRTHMNRKIFSMDASKPRSKTLQKMVSLAGADGIVTILPGQDFLAVDPHDKRFANVTGLLLDPSCSGSGIVGRDDVPLLALPSPAKSTGKKRKRGHEEKGNEVQRPPIHNILSSSTDENDTPTAASDPERLAKLSNLQARIVEHALTFPSAMRITYSTCSIHSVENERVVSRVLKTDVARRQGWRLLRRDEQCEGLRRWAYRGIRDNANVENGNMPVDSTDLSDSDLDACIRCWPGEEGLGGFFVAGFVRDEADEVQMNGNEANGDEDDDYVDEEWEGFSD